MRVAVPTLGLVALVSACAGGSGGSSVVPTPTPAPLTSAEIAARVDSQVAQQVANQVGPGASIRAEYANSAGVRRVVASFHLNADAYVLVGHIDADGVLRIVFPADPKDDGFVKGDRDYRTPEFFAGFAEEYRFRARQGYNFAARPTDSYDGQLGYAFIIASWRPLKVSEFQTGGAWDTFELADDKYLTDPRPAIYEMASLLVGQNREAYTVEFARYANSSSLYAGSGYGFGSGYGYGYGSVNYCAGYGALGWSLSSFGSQSMFSPVYTNSLYPVAYYSRGQYLFYDQLSDCYRTGYPPGGYPGFYGNNYGYRVASDPTPTTPVPLRGFTPRDRTPIGSDFGAHALPVNHLVATDKDGDVPQPSASYRQRGLITAEDPGTLPGRREPSIDAHSEVQNHTRPSIQEMVGRQPQGTDASSNAWMRAQAAGRTSNPSSSTYTPANRRADPSTGDSRGYQQPQAETRSVAPVNREPVSRPSPPVETRTTQAPPPSPPPASAPAAPPSSSSSPPPASTGSRPPTPF